MAGDQLVRRIAVAMLAPALGQHVFILRFQHREPPDFFQVTGKAGFGRQNRQSRSSGHLSALLSLPPVTGGRCAPPLPEPTALVYVATANTIAGQHYRTNGGERKI